MALSRMPTSAQTPLAAASPMGITRPYSASAFNGSREATSVDVPNSKTVYPGSLIYSLFSFPSALVFVLIKESIKSAQVLDDGRDSNSYDAWCQNIAAARPLDSQKHFEKAVRGRRTKTGNPSQNLIRRILSTRIIHRWPQGDYREYPETALADRTRILKRRAQ